MKKFMIAAMLVGAAVAGASTAAGTTDTDISKKITHEIRMYSRYSIWDDVQVSVNQGQVELMGAVNQPYKKSDIGRIAKSVAGVTGVKNELKVLPLSPFDDRIRLQVARAIYGDTTLSRYAMQPVPSIHIIVENGHVTLTGVVARDMDKQIAEIRASGAGLSFGKIDNRLVVEQPAKKS